MNIVEVILISLGVAIISFIAGIAASSNLTAQHCEDYGKFKHNKVIYECRRLTNE